MNSPWPFSSAGFPALPGPFGDLATLSFDGVKVPRFSDDLINRVASATDILSLARPIVDLKRSGASWVGLCPFHNEKTPSFHVNAEKGTYHCFGCGQGGNVFKFHMLTRGLTFPEAVKELAERAGIELPKDAGGGGQAPTLDGRPLKTVLYELMKLASGFFENELWLPQNREALSYLVEGRGLSAEVVKKYGLGLAPDSWDALMSRLLAKRFSHKSLLAAGLIKARSQGDGYYDIFRRRLMIPVADIENRVVAMAGRTWRKDEDQNTPKYINSPATDIYTKGRLLYGLHQARPHVRNGGLVFLVEGYFDLISLVSAGVKPVAAVMGTALTSHQLSTVKNMAKEVHLVFDSDSAGEEATKRALPLLYNLEMEGRVIRLPEGHDPDTFVREYGAEAFYDLADSAMDIADYFVSRLIKPTGGTLTGEAQLVTRAQEVLSQVPDAAKCQYLRVKLAERLGISPELLVGNPAAKRPVVIPRTQAKLGERGAGPRDPLAERLLRHVLTYPESASVLTWDLTEIWMDLPTKPLLEAVVKQYEAAGVLSPENLHLEDDDLAGNLVSLASVSPKTLGQAESKELAEAMIDKMRQNRKRHDQAKVTQDVRAAEAAGDTELVLKLMANKSV